jgi:hypothetical protein
MEPAGTTHAWPEQGLIVKDSFGIRAEGVEAVSEIER